MLNIAISLVAIIILCSVFCIGGAICDAICERSERDADCPVYK